MLCTHLLCIWRFNSSEHSNVSWQTAGLRGISQHTWWRYEDQDIPRDGVGPFRQMDRYYRFGSVDAMQDLTRRLDTPIWITPLSLAPWPCLLPHSVYYNYVNQTHPKNSLLRVIDPKIWGIYRPIDCLILWFWPLVGITAIGISVPVIRSTVVLLIVIVFIQCLMRTIAAYLNTGRNLYLQGSKELWRYIS